MNIAVLGSKSLPAFAGADRVAENILLHLPAGAGHRYHIYVVRTPAQPRAFDFAPHIRVIPIPAVHCMDLIHEGRMKKDQVDDLGDILTGKIPVHRKENEIVVYDTAGVRGAFVTMMLRYANFLKSANYDEGFQAWAGNAELPLVKP